MWRDKKEDDKNMTCVDDEREQDSEVLGKQTDIA